jgi:hypothetical protein
MTMYQTAQRHSPEDRNIRFHSCLLIVLAYRLIAVSWLHCCCLDMFHFCLCLLHTPASLFQNIHCNLTMLGARGSVVG